MTLITHRLAVQHSQISGVCAEENNALELMALTLINDVQMKNL